MDFNFVISGHLLDTEPFGAGNTLISVFTSAISNKFLAKSIIFISSSSLPTLYISPLVSSLSIICVNESKTSLI